MASVYRLLAADLLTDRLIDVLPVQDLAFDDFIGKTGALSGVIPVPDPGMAARVRAAILPARTALWVERGSDVWWGGILGTPTPRSDGRGGAFLDVQAATFDSYLNRRLVLADLAFRQTDPLGIARGLVEYAASLPGGDIGLLLDPQTSGVLRDRAYRAADAARVRDLLDDLAAEEEFEWRVQAYRDATGARVKRLQLGSPRIQSGAAPVVLTHPGNVLEYSQPTDGTGMANVWQSRGATVESDLSADSGPLLSGVHVDTDRLAAGWPRLDGTSDYPSVTDRTTLDALAGADLARARDAIVIPSVRVRLGGEVSPALIGSRVRLRIRDVWHPEGLDVVRRVVGLRVEPAERGREENAELYLEA